MSVHLGAFTLIRPVRRGGMGEVWMARHRPHGRIAAIKVLHTGTSSSTMLRGLRTEIRAIATLDHPRIVRLLDHGHVQASEAQDNRLQAGTPWLAMEFVGGGTMQQTLDPSWPQARAWMLDLLEALAHAHARGVIHRDLKPENVLFDPQGRVKLTDFGLAYLQELHLGGNERAPLGGGTAAWMAPEQHAKRWVDQGPWTDLYTLGVVGWRLLTDARPFEGRADAVRQAHLTAPLPAFQPRIPVPSGVEDWLRKLLEKDPYERFTVAAEARAALAAFPAGPVQPRRPVGIAPALPTAMDSSDYSIGSGRDPVPGLERLRQPRLVGRERTRALAIDTMKGLHAPRVLVLRGPSGVGKTRLARWVFEQAQERGLAAGLTASAESGGLETLLKRHARCIADEQLEERLEDTLSRLGDVDPQEHAELLEFLKQPTRTPRERRQALTQRYLARVARERPLVVWLDDAHRSPEFLRFALRLARSQEHTPILLLMTIQEEGLRNPELLDHLELQANAQVLHIGRLSPAAHHKLLTESLDLSPAAAELVAETTQGNPLFSVQLVDHWMDQGALRPSPSGLQLRSSARLLLPDSLHEIWQERTASLLRQDPSWAEPLRLAALLGLEVSDRTWKAACAALGREAPDALVDALQRARLARPEPQGWAFAHSMLRSSILRGAEESNTLKALHRACAAALPHDDARRAQHLAAAGQLEEALPLLLTAAQACMDASEWARAVRLLQHREECLDRLDAGPRDPRRVEGWLTLSAAQRHLGQLDTAAHLVRRTLLAATDSGHASLQVQAHLAQVEIHRSNGAPHDAVASAETAARLARSLHTRSLHSLALYRLGMARRDAGQLRRAGSHLEDALSLGGRARWASDAWLGLASIALELDHPTLCSRALGEARLRARVLAQPYILAQVELLEGDLLRHSQRRPDEARALYQRALASFERLGSLPFTAQAFARLGIVALLKGEHTQAHLHLERALDLVPSHHCSIAHLGLAILEANSEAPEAFNLHMARAGVTPIPHRELAQMLPVGLELSANWPERRQALLDLEAAPPMSAGPAQKRVPTP